MNVERSRKQYEPKKERTLIYLYVLRHCTNDCISVPTTLARTERTFSWSEMASASLDMFLVCLIYDTNRNGFEIFLQDIYAGTAREYGSFRYFRIICLVFICLHFIQWFDNLAKSPAPNPLFCKAYEWVGRFRIRC